MIDFGRPSMGSSRLLFNSLLGPGAPNVYRQPVGGGSAYARKPGPSSRAEMAVAPALPGSVAVSAAWPAMRL